jgi:hypothetical protein
MKALFKLRRYGLAAISSAVALARPIDAPASCFLLAPAAEQFLGGLGPGLLSVALSALAFRYLFLRRIIPPAIEGAAFLRFSIFLLATLRRPLVGWWPTFVRRQLSLYLPGNAVIH